MINVSITVHAQRHSRFAANVDGVLLELVGRTNIYIEPTRRVRGRIAKCVINSVWAHLAMMCVDPADQRQIDKYLAELLATPV